MEMLFDKNCGAPPRHTEWSSRKYKFSGKNLPERHRWKWFQDRKARRMPEEIARSLDIRTMGEDCVHQCVISEPAEMHPLC